MTRNDVLALLTRRKDAMARRDVKAFADIYAASARLESPLAGSVTGLDAVKNGTEAFFTAFPDAQIVEEPPIIDGHQATIVGDITGTHMGGLLGLPPSGRPFRFAVAFVFECQDDRIIRERRIYDFTGLLVQVGVLTAKPAGSR
jgi:predicted ester cyclase